MSIEKSYIIKLFTEEWAGNFDSKIQMALLGIDDDRHGAHSGKYIYEEFYEEYLKNNPSVELEELLDPEDYGLIENLYRSDEDFEKFYTVAREFEITDKIVSYVQFEVGYDLPELLKGFIIASMKNLKDLDIIKSFQVFEKTTETKMVELTV